MDSGPASWHEELSSIEEKVKSEHFFIFWYPQVTIKQVLCDVGQLPKF